MIDKKKELLHKKLKQISAILQDRYADNPDIGVLSGISGIALFHYYYFGLVQEISGADHGAEILETVIKKINDGYHYPTFCTGIAGAAWTIETLYEEHFIDINNDDLLSGLDDFLAEAMEVDMNKNDYDFLHGAIGYGYYFLKRYKNTRSIVLKKQYKEFILRITQALRKASQQDKKGIYWKSVLNKEAGTIGVNLSLSHGVSSTINFLCRLYIYNDFRDAVRDMLTGAISYVLKFKKQDHSLSSLFPSWICDDVEQEENSRLAWCYGDLGIGITLWQAGKALDDPGYKEEAINILKHSAKRRDLKEAKVIDANLCHGAFGIMNIYNYMYKETSEQLFRDTTDFWMDKALDMAIHQNGYAGYMQWRGDIGKWEKEINVLEGIAGIGLSIISYLAPFDTSWNECLMMS